MCSRSFYQPSGDQPSPDSFLFKMTIKKFKSDIGEDFYKERVTEYARDKNVGLAVKLCDTCGDLEFCHRPGVCKRSDKSSCKLTEEELREIQQCINRDIIEEIIANAKNDEKCGDMSTNDRLATALDKISDVLTQRSTVPSQVTKVKAPPLWAKEGFIRFCFNNCCGQNSTEENSFINSFNSQGKI